MPPLLVGWVIDSVRREPPEWIAVTLGTSDPWKLAFFLADLNGQVGPAIDQFKDLIVELVNLLAQRVNLTQRAVPPFPESYSNVTGDSN